MKVKALPLKLRGDSLSAHTEWTRNFTEWSWEQGAIRRLLWADTGANREYPRWNWT